MTKTKFTLNSFILILIIFSALAFLFTVKLTNIADRFPINEHSRIENTDYSVVYSSLEPNGIYKGADNTGVLVIEGRYGTDWGSALEGKTIYTNEYSASSMGMIFCNLVKIDTDSLKKETVYKDTVLRGRCASGELICVRGEFMSSNFPENNSLCRLYSMTSEKIKTNGETAEIVIIDAKSGKTVFTHSAKGTDTTNIDKLYGGKTLEEIKNEIRN